MLRKAGGENFERSGFSWVGRAASDQLLTLLLWSVRVGLGGGVARMPDSWRNIAITLTIRVLSVIA
jgi:hypothetical protein